MILRCRGLTPHFQIELTRTGRLDDMTVHVECAPAMATAEARASAAETLARHIKEIVGLTSRIEVRDPGAIARSEGKAKRVVDNRPKS
jgi:phenylacetate-CoA ligase